MVTPVNFVFQLGNSYYEKLNNTALVHSLPICGNTAKYVGLDKVGIRLNNNNINADDDNKII